MEIRFAYGYPNNFGFNSYDTVCLDLMDNQFKRPNKLTGKPYEPGFEDASGRVFLRYINKHGNDGYYLEEWKKDMDSYLKKVNELNTNPD